VFAGAASKPATEEVVKAFEKKTGVKVNVTFGGSGLFSWFFRLYGNC